MELLQEYVRLAKQRKAKIVFCEAGYSPRIREAIKRLLKDNICSVIAIGSEAELKDLPSSAHLSKIDINAYDKTALIDRLYQLRAHKGLTHEEAEQMINNPVVFGTMLVNVGKADGMVAGAETPSADVLRVALQTLRSKGQFVHSAMLLVKKDCPPLIMADVALNIDPTAEQLVTITCDSAHLGQKLFGTANVALLSYSTYGSAKGESADKVRQVAEILKSQKLDFDFIGEVQADVALSAQVAQHKKVNSAIAGKANVLIVPNIDTGNIGYKLVQQLAHYTAVGPITVGLDKPVNDLSRGATVDDIYYTTIITILQK